MSFPVKTVTHKEINGSYKLQPQSCLTTPVQAIAMCENSQSSVEEVISIDEGAPIGVTGNDQNSSYSTIPLSKKAIHQRDADENLFLRFLELDPPADSTDTAATSTAPSANGTSVAAAIAVPATPDLRRKTTNRPNSGRTPFTITKKLMRSTDKGYGFSIVWTHPPRIEKVEPGLSADKAGIIPGDFVIFVDKHNVVTMPELDILNLIRSQGNTLCLEIFRRSTQTKASNGYGASKSVNARRQSLTISNNQMMVEQATSKQSLAAAAAAAAALMEPRPSTACSNTSYSMETTKRRLNLPQVTFSKEVGNGVIV